jgi:hypothetical protein
VRKCSRSVSVSLATSCARVAHTAAAMILHDPQEEVLQRLRDLILASCYSACEIVVATGNPVALIVHMARARTVILGYSTFSGGVSPKESSVSHPVQCWSCDTRRRLTRLPR